MDSNVLSKRFFRLRAEHIIQRKAREAELKSIGHPGPKTEALKEYPHWFYWSRREFFQWVFLNILYRENNYVSRF
jgi:hypothetical protein